MNIILTGLRGSGKSTIGKIISKKLNFNFTDLDNEIEEFNKMKISDMVKQYGWPYFREKEREAVKRIEISNNTVISSGGGTIVDRKNEKILKKTGKIIYLYCKPETCAKRISNDTNRPPLTDKKTTLEELNEIYKERNNRYCKSADIIFQRTENPENDANKIIKKLKLNNEN